MRSSVKKLIDSKVLHVVDEDIALMDEYENASSYNMESMFDRMLYYSVLEWMKDNKQLREQIKDCISSLK